MSDKVQKIKEEIERRIDLYSIAEKDDSTFARMGELSSLIDFIDSLQEEPNVKNENPSDECPCCGWALDSDGCCSSCGYGRK